MATAQSPQSLTKFFESTVQEGRCGDDEVISIITTDRVDRDGEVVIPSGINLRDYQLNPVVNWGHAKGRPEEGEFGLPIGKNIFIRPSSDGHALIAKTRIDVGHGISREICGKIKRGFLNAWSITFIPRSFGPPTREEIAGRPDWANAKTIYRKVDLIEYSCVLAPSNIDAITLEKRAREHRLTGGEEAKAMKPPSDSATVNEDRGEEVEETEDEKYKAMCAAAVGEFEGMKHKPGAALHAHKAKMALHHEAGQDPDFDEMATHKMYAAVPNMKMIGCSKGGPNGDGYEKIAECHGQHPGEAGAESKAMSETVGAEGGFAVPAGLFGHERDGDEDDDDEDNEVEEHGAIRRHGFATLQGGNHHKGVGRVHSIHTRGMVPDVENEMIATKESPAARVQIFRAYGGGHVPTDTHIAHRVSKMQRCEDLKPPAGRPLGGKPIAKPARKPGGKSTTAPEWPTSPLTQEEIYKAHAEALLNSPKLKDVVAEAIQDRFDVARGKV